MVIKMSEIQINLKKLEEQISQLRVLNENLKASVTISPTCSGGGKTVQQIENMTSNCLKVHNDLINLFSNTISFLENVEKSYENADKNASLK